MSLSICTKRDRHKIRSLLPVVTQAMSKASAAPPLSASLWNVAEHIAPLFAEDRPLIFARIIQYLIFRWPNDQHVFAAKKLYHICSQTRIAQRFAHSLSIGLLGYLQLMFWQWNLIQWLLAGYGSALLLFNFAELQMKCRCMSTFAHAFELANVPERGRNIQMLTRQKPFYQVHVRLEAT